MENTSPLYSLSHYGISPWALIRMGIEHRRLIWRLAARELIARYRGSVFGFLWLFFTPLCMLAIYTVIFSQVFKARWDVAFDSPFDFALILFLGLILFNLFGEVFARAPTLMLENVSYIKKVVFPLEILSIVSVLVALVNAVISLGILLVFYLFVRGVPPLMVMTIPLYLLPCAFFGLGSAWLLSSLGVFLRDLKPLVALVSMVLLFLSPIFYPLSAVPEKLQQLIILNPLSQIIEDARAVMFKHQSPHVTWLLFQIALSWLFAWGTYLWFMKTKKGFADVV